MGYVRITVDFSALLLPDVRLPLAQFQGSWAQLGPGKESTLMYDGLIPVPNGDASKLADRLRARNLLIVQHTNPAPGHCHAMQIGACSLNRLAVLADAQFRNAGAKVSLRSDVAPLLPLVAGVIEKALRSTS